MVEKAETFSHQNKDNRYLNIILLCLMVKINNFLTCKDFKLFCTYLRVCIVHPQYQSLYYPTNALNYINRSLLKPVND
jgi:hypothetical protein